MGLLNLPALKGGDSGGTAVAASGGVTPGSGPPDSPPFLPPAISLGSAGLRLDAPRGGGRDGDT